MTELNRATFAAAAVPDRVRMVHLGLGAFHRAHQAWYTQHAGDGWGIAAFTGRSPRAARGLTAQDGLYALVERSATADAVEIITSVSEAHDGADLARLAELLADPAVAVVTLTVTEAGYRVNGEGELDLADRELAADIRVLRAGRTDATARLSTPLGRLLFGLRARRAAEAGSIAVVPCDNIPANGAVIRRGLTALAHRVDGQLAGWIDGQVSFVSTSVDRITPANRRPVQAVVRAGWHDRMTVVTEPFADWVLEGEFPAGRPAWEKAGARFVDRIGPWEDRKLWLLNGAHTILAVAGLRRGRTTVAEAFGDPACRALVEAFWAEAITCLPTGIEHVEYRRQLVERFTNPRIVHPLDQIAADTTTKIRYRIVPVTTQLLARGAEASACADALAAWIAAAQDGLSAADSRAGEVRAATSAADPLMALLRLVGADLDPDFVGLVRARAATTP